MRATGRVRFAAAGVLGLVVLAFVAVAPALACSPPFEPIKLRDLGPSQVVVVGTIGDRVPGGRVFHVERWFNGGVPSPTILIAFKEGEPIGDCSYPVHTGQRLIIAPWREPDGRLSADMVTPQDDPAGVAGQRYVREAVELYGAGVVPPQRAPDADPASADGRWIIVAAIGLATVGLVAAVLLRRHRPGASRG